MSRVIGIKGDEIEFIKIAKGLIRKDLGRFLLKARFQAGQVLIPVAFIDIPTFRYGFPDDFVIGQGKGGKGDDVGGVPDEEGEGEGGGAGEGGGSKIIIAIDEEEFLMWFEELLELPRLEPKGNRTIFEEREKYSSIHRLGPKSALHRGRTFKEALRRSVGIGAFHPPDKTEIVIQPPDMRYKETQKIREPKNNALLVFARDISGSMGVEEAEALSTLCDYCERWIRASYKEGQFEAVYIVHDGEAQEVTRQEFLATESRGGTIVSTAHKLCFEIIDERFPPDQWNIYMFYFSDGFNFSNDNDAYLLILREKLLPILNQYSYGQTEITRSWWNTYRESGADTFSQPGTIGKLLEDEFGDAENVVTAVITGSDQDSVIQAIKKFFGKKG